MPEGNGGAPVELATVTLTVEEACLLHGMYVLATEAVNAVVRDPRGAAALFGEGAGHVFEAALHIQVKHAAEDFPSLREKIKRLVEWRTAAADRASGQAGG